MLTEIISGVVQGSCIETLLFYCRLIVLRKLLMMMTCNLCVICRHVNL